jgi:hypothetical protein
MVPNLGQLNVIWRNVVMKKSKEDMYKKRLFCVPAVRQARSESAQHLVYEREAIHSYRWTDGGPLLRFPGANWITWMKAPKPISVQKLTCARVTGLPLRILMLVWSSPICKKVQSILCAPLKRRLCANKGCLDSATIPPHALLCPLRGG